MNHKAKLWNLYEELYGEISREAETDFHFLFGEEFLRASDVLRGVGRDAPPHHAHAREADNAKEECCSRGNAPASPPSREPVRTHFFSPLPVLSCS